MNFSLLTLRDVYCQFLPILDPADLLLVNCFVFVFFFLLQTSDTEFDSRHIITSGPDLTCLFI